MIAIYGCGGHARSVADVLLNNEPHTELVFIDENAKSDEKIFGFKVLSRVKEPVVGMIIAVGDNSKRKEIFAGMDRSTLLAVVSKRAYLGYDCRLGDGVFVAHACHVGPLATIGDNVILNTGSIVEHETAIGRHTHIGPHATVAGRARIGELVFIGAGATVIDGVRICSDVVIGADATVIEDITDPGIYIGTPARRIS